jgi:L-ascorbate metabolism protein UlaG (beta-lactamase superfamily)
MKRRQLLQYTATVLLTGIATTFTSNKSSLFAQTANNLTIQWLGHTCFLLTGNGLRILINPFRPLGCTQGYNAPRPVADVVLISSQLLDEGAAENLPNDPEVLFEPGEYKINNLDFDGILIPHENDPDYIRNNVGMKYMPNVAWVWNQSNLKILHLGGAGASIGMNEKIFINNPDIMFIPVGSPRDNDLYKKGYQPQQAINIIRELRPKMVFPTHYRGSGASDTCPLSPVDEFLALATENNISHQRINNNALAVNSNNLPAQTPVIRVLSDSSLLRN